MKYATEIITLWTFNDERLWVKKMREWEWHGLCKWRRVKHIYVLGEWQWLGQVVDWMCSLGAMQHFRPASHRASLYNLSFNRSRSVLKKENEKEWILLMIWFAAFEISQYQSWCTIFAAVHIDECRDLGHSKTLANLRSREGITGRDMHRYVSLLQKAR